MERAHRKNTKTFEEETYAEQAKTINAEILNLEAAIKANIKRALKEGRKNPKDARIINILGLVERMVNYNPK